MNTWPRFVTLTVALCRGAAVARGQVAAPQQPAAIGRSIHDELLHARLNEARRLITTTSLPLKVIAPRSGLRSTTYMATLFRRHFRTAPAALRQAARRAGP